MADTYNYKNKTLKMFKKDGSLTKAYTNRVLNNQTTLINGYKIENNKIVKDEMKTIKFRGKQIKYSNTIDLANKMDISPNQATELLNDYKTGKINRYVWEDDDVVKFSLKNKPLLKTPFALDKISNKTLLGGKNKKLNIGKSLPQNKKYKLYITITAKFDWSGDKGITRTLPPIQMNIKPSDIDAEELVKEQFPDATNIRDIKTSIIGEYGGKKMDFKDAKLFDGNTHLKLNQFQNEIIYNDNWKDCVVDYLSETYKKISHNNIAELRTVRDILEFCKKYKIKMICYDVNGNVVESHYPPKKNKTYKTLVFIAYNNHLYPLKNKYLRKTCDTMEHKKVSDVHKEMFEIVTRKNELPYDINIYKGNIQSFVYNNIRYYENREYETVDYILHQFGITDKWYPELSINAIGGLLEKAYNIKGCDSFIPNDNKFVKGGYNYNNPDVDETKCITIDKNKCYSYILRMLKYLIKCDIRLNGYAKYNGESIMNYYLYNVEIEGPCILLPQNGLYTGGFLKYCKREDLKFKIIEFLETTIIDNLYEPLIKDIYKKLDPQEAKKIVNIMIGKFEKPISTDQTLKFNKMCNQDEATTFDGYKKHLYGEYTLCYDKKDTFNIYNKKPISIQIKDESRKMLYEMMKDLNLENEDIKQVKTDSITFINKTDDYKQYIGNGLDDWKMEHYTAITATEIPKINLTLEETCKGENTNELWDCYAGAGKSYKIINEVIPKLNGDYIVLTPSHACLKDYRKLGLKCDVIQKYIYAKNTNLANNIIIDECGMLNKNSWDYVYKLHLTGRTIMAYGDFKQLLPVDIVKKQLNTLLFTNNLFSNKIEMNTNYRNNFTKEEYDMMRACSENEKVELINKYNAKNYYEADYIITYKNETRRKYNQLMCERLDIKNLDDVGTKLICKTNKLASKNIYNKFMFIVKQTTNEKIIITDGSEDYEITEKELNSNFDYGYAVTLYCIQGGSVKSIYYAPEDMDNIKGRGVYTLISRLKTKN